MDQSINIEPATGNRPYHSGASKRPPTGRRGRSKNGRVRIGNVDPMDNSEADLIAALKKAKIGDEEGRRLFVISLKFGLGTLEPEIPMIQAAETPPTYDPGLMALSQNITALTGQMGELTDDARTVLIERLTDNDPFGRTYNDEFLATFERLLSQMQNACEQLEPGEPADPQIDPAFYDNFKTIVARSYRQAFEKQSQEGFDKVLGILEGRMGISA